MLLLGELFGSGKKLIRSGGGDGYWAHVLWQRHGLRMEDFAVMPRTRQLFYIASELIESEDPCRLDTRQKGGVR